MAALLGLDESDNALAVDLLAGRGELRGRNVEDRLVCLYQIRKTLHSLLRDEQVENEWLRERHPGLEGKRPMGPRSLPRNLERAAGSSATGP